MTNQANRKRSAYFGAVVALLIVLALVSLVLARSEQWTGTVLFDANKVGPSNLIEAVKASIESYESLIKLVIATVGVVAFLVTYHKDRSVPLTRRAFALLAAAMIFLVGALFCALFGNELIFVMVGRNAIDLSLPALAVARRSLYLLLFLAAATIGLFALEVLDRGGTGEKPGQKQQ